MPRFHLDAPLAAGQELELPAPVVRHVQVRRMQPGQCVTLFNGAGGQWRARIARMGRGSVAVQVLAFEDVEREAARPVHLGCGLIDASRFDWLVEKACELGAASLTPLRLARSHAHAGAARRMERWRSIAAAACEQCGRNRLMTINAPCTLDAWMNALERGAQRLMLDFDGSPLGTALRPATAETQPLALLSGPEGGLTEDERAAARAADFTPASLGNRTLRAETAPLAALALVLA